MSVARIGHIAFTVTDLDRSVRFAEESIGLRVVERSDNTAYLSSNSRHHQLRLTHGPTHACEEIAFDVDDRSDWESVLGDASRAGFEILDGSDDDRFVERMARVCVPDGPVLAICLGAASIAPEYYSTLGVRPRKLGHATLSSPDPRGVGRALSEVLGFRLSDRLPLGDEQDGELSWYRCNSDHHAIGLKPGPRGVHHYAFELEGFSSFGVAGDHLSAAGIKYIWGPGRHGPGDNLFAYFRDADGSMIEFYGDMQQIEDERGYVMKTWPDVESSANLWGPVPSAEWFEFATPFAS